MRPRARLRRDASPSRLALSALAAAMLFTLAAVLPAAADAPAPYGTDLWRALGTPAPESVNWKVVYVVGDLDYYGWGTQASISYAMENARELRDLGLEVVELYPPDNRWESVKEAARNANILIYNGHGWRWDDSRTLVGGFYLQPDEAIHPDSVRDELRMLPNAIIIFNHACYAAGYSSEDWGIISLEEARRRVALYSLPFLQAGLGAYYADNWYHSPVELLRSLVEGQTLEDAFKSQASFDANVAVQTDHPEMNDLALWTSPDFWGGAPYYNHAFVGPPSLTAAELFSRPTTGPAVLLRLSEDAVSRTLGLGQ